MVTHRQQTAAVQLIQAKICIIEDYRCDEKWDLLWMETEAIVTSLNISMENHTQTIRWFRLLAAYMLPSIIDSILY